MRCVGVLFVLLLAAVAVVAAPGEEMVRPEVQQAVARGLGYLARQQQADGSFTGFDENGPRALPAAVAVLGFLSTGHTPREGRYALVVHNAVDYLVRSLPDDEDFGKADGSGVRGLAFITMALAETSGLERDAAQRTQVRAMLQRSLTAILKGQDAKGAWTGAGEGKGELVPTALMVLALRALGDAGLNVPAGTMERAGGFARSCLRKDGKGFEERGGGGGNVNAAGVLIVLVSGGKVGEVAGALTAVAEGRADENTGDYATWVYLSVAASRFAGEGALAASWNVAREGLLQGRFKQTEEGSWFPPRAPAVGTGGVESTGLAVMTLGVGWGVLPVYGR